MKTLIAVFSSLGLGLGLLVGVLAHGHAPSVAGYTFYTSQPRRYADYLPAGHPWFPGLIEYAATGLGIGLAIALILGVTGFRLTRRRRAVTR